MRRLGSDILLTYNIILGCLTLNAIKTVLAPSLLLIQFELDDKVKKFYGDQKMVRECYYVSLKSLGRKEEPLLEPMMVLSASVEKHRRPHPEPTYKAFPSLWTQNVPSQCIAKAKLNSLREQTRHDKEEIESLKERIWGQRAQKPGARGQVEGTGVPSVASTAHPSSHKYAPEDLPKEDDMVTHVSNEATNDVDDDETRA
ncbi:hypothetical protein Cgig2_030256 [Carnegiea gigantea]|uniref:Uncharacterized protein n=1 Tax=Carnegiea gigantea TaxID=171969 RepID=A0A9Q1QAW5_9CARY|nr:hypothetical protein Cgig2_030256 [Carnegiea gigantea]